MTFNKRKINERIIIIVMIALCNLILTSCYQDFEINSLNEYIKHIEENGNGFSDVSIDHPDYFLPSKTFIQDYDYIDGKYYWHEDDPLRGMFTSNVRPDISFLYLKYNENMYYNAKQFMLENIWPYNNKLYRHNNYVFYENSNYIILNNNRNFPESFTMVCYNDVIFTLIFMGFDSGTLAGSSCLEEKYVDNIGDNWDEFIHHYYGVCYNFDE